MAASETALRTFTIEGHFQATDIEDAFQRLARHFLELAMDDDAGSSIAHATELGLSHIRIEPAERRAG